MRPPYRLVFLAVCLVAMLTGCLTEDENTPPPPPDDNDEQGEVGEPDRVPIDPKTDAPDPDEGCARIAGDNDCTP